MPCPTDVGNALAVGRLSDLEAAIKAGDAATAVGLVRAEPELSREPTSVGVSAILMALYFGRPEVALAIAGTRDLDIFEAAALGDVGALNRIAEIDPEAIGFASPDGFTALGYAAYFGHAGTARALLELGADPNRKSQNGLAVAPLHSALSGNHREIADMLIDLGADVNLASGEGWTPLHYVAHNGDAEIAETLIAKGAKVQKNSEGKTPADIATESGFPELARRLA